MMLATRSLPAPFGVEILAFDLTQASKDRHYSAIRALFEEHSLLLFRNQKIDDHTHTKIAQWFGTPENREAMAKNVPHDFQVSLVSNDDGTGTAIPDDAMHLLDLQANMLWHTDSTFLPVPALANLLLARTLPRHGGETEFASTRISFADLPRAEQERLETEFFWHSLIHSRAQIDAKLAQTDKITRWQN